MLAFITNIIKLLVKLIFVEQLAQENEQLKKEKQRWEQEKEELTKAKQDLLQQNFNLIQKYVSLNNSKEKLLKELSQYRAAKSDRPTDHVPTPIHKGLNYPKYPTSKPMDINHHFDPDDMNVIDQLLQEFNCLEELTI